MGKAFLAGQGQVGGQIVTGQITGNNTTTLEITDINTQPRFIFITATGINGSGTLVGSKFIWFDDTDSANWLSSGNNIYAIRNYTLTSFTYLSSQTTRANATARCGYYDSVNKKIVLQDTAEPNDKFVSTQSYAYLIGY